MFKNIYLLVIIISFFSLSSWSQESFADRFQDANLSMEDKKYNQAVEILEQLLIEDPDNANLQYRLGVCYSHLPLKDELAIKYLEAASDNVVSNYNPIYHTEKSAPKELFYYLATVYLDFGKPKDAIENYELFLSQVGKKHILAKKARHGIESSNTAIEMMADPVDVEVENLGPKINSKYDEHSPVLTLDEQIIYFTSQRLRVDSSNADYLDENGDYFEDIYTSYKDENGAWTDPEILPFSRKKSHDATSFISASGNELYIYREEQNGTILESKLVDNSWLTPKRLGSNINSKEFENHVSISSDNQMLFFSSDRKGGLGGMDIYYCKRLPNGYWGLAQNIGAPINTEYDDQAPNIHPDGKTMYFSSKGHKNMGGYDILYSEIQEDGSWSKPENLGYPVNTTSHEQVFFVSPDGKRGYYQSHGVGGYGSGDIYLMSLKQAKETGLTLLKGKIVLPEGAPFPDKIRILVTDVETGKFIAEARPNPRNGSYVFIIPPGKNYKLTYELDGQEFYSETTFVPLGSEYKEIKKEVMLDPVKLAAEQDGAVIVENKTKEITPIWQLRFFDSAKKVTEGQTVQYLSAKTGNVLYQEKVDNAGFFKFHKVENDEYIFRVQNLIDADLCDGGEIVLVNGDSDLGQYKLLADNNCVFKKYTENSAYVYYPSIASPNYSGAKVNYLDDKGNSLFSSVVDSKGNFSHYDLPSFRNYIVKLDGSNHPCADAVITINGTKNDRIFLMPDKNRDCYFVPSQPKQFKYVGTDTLAPGVIARYLAENGTTLYDEKVTNNSFKYHLLSSSTPYRIKLLLNDQTLCKSGEMVYKSNDGSGMKLKADNDCIYQVYDITEPIKPKVEQVIAEVKEPKTDAEIKEKFESTLVQNSASVNQAAYKTNFGYNKNSINVNSADFKKFINELLAIHNNGGVIKLSVESGASKVPTSSFKNNEDLARLRAVKAKDLVTQVLKSKGVPDAKISFVNISYLVQGPDYAKDAYNVRLYEPFQYVKLWSVNNK